MQDLIVGVGLVLVIEGLVWALIPSTVITLLEAAKATPESVLRTIGVISVAAGVFVVWLVRG